MRVPTAAAAARRFYEFPRAYRAGIRLAEEHGEIRRETQRLARPAGCMGPSAGPNNDLEILVGKGDRKTKRGKIWRQTHGKARSSKGESARARKRHGPKPSQLQQKNKDS